MAVGAQRRIIDVITWIDCNGINEVRTIPVDEERTVDYVKSWIMDNKGVDRAYQAVSYWCNHANDWAPAPWMMQMMSMEYNGEVWLRVQDSQRATDERAPITDAESDESMGGSDPNDSPRQKQEKKWRLLRHY